MERKLGDSSSVLGGVRIGTLMAVVLLTGCTSIGPGTVNRDRLDYTTSVAESWQRQMLLNLVKLRYGDTPMFLDVGQIVSGYQLSSTVSVSGNVSDVQGGALVGSARSTVGLGAQGQFIDRPTVTYTPLVGEQFARQLMAPIPPASLISLVQSGTPIDLIFRLAVQEVNGIRNRSASDARAHPPDPRFYELLERMRRIQAAGNISMRVHRQDQGAATVIAIPKQGERVDETDSVAFRELLGLDQAASEFRVVYGATANDDRELALLTRSVYQVLLSIASSIDAPAAHVAERRVGANQDPDVGPEGPVPQLIRISSSTARPTDPFVAVPYRGHWFWIDDRDLPSKRMFTSLLFVFALVDTGAKGPGAVLTIPAQ